MGYRPISNDLNVTILKLHRAGRLSKADIIGNKIWSRATFYRRLSDQQSRRFLPGRPRLIPPRLVRHLREIVERRPESYLDELKDYIRDAEGLEVSTSTVHRTLLRAGISYKRAHRIARERSLPKRQDYVLRIGELYKAEQLVFADETAYDDRDGARLYARAPLGVKAPVTRPYVRGQRLSCIAALTGQGLIAPWTVAGAFNEESFHTYLLLELLPKMSPFPASNSVLILDNASIHHSQRIRQLVEDFGCRLEFLPPYSPDFNPIERAFSKIKAKLRREEAMHASPASFYAAAFEVTECDCRAWKRLAGY